MKFLLPEVLCIVKVTVNAGESFIASSLSFTRNLHIICTSGFSLINKFLFFVSFRQTNNKETWINFRFLHLFFLFIVFK
jgi:hypothetical protein